MNTTPENEWVEKLRERVESLMLYRGALPQEGKLEDILVAAYHRGQENMKRKAIEAAKEYLTEDFREPEDRPYNNGVRDCIHSLQALKTD